jgi:hypothetical protein
MTGKLMLLGRKGSRNTLHIAVQFGGNESLGTFLSQEANYLYSACGIGQISLDYEAARC